MWYDFYRLLFTVKIIWDFFLKILYIRTTATIGMNIWTKVCKKICVTESVKNCLANKCETQANEVFYRLLWRWPYKRLGYCWSLISITYKTGELLKSEVWVNYQGACFERNIYSCQPNKWDNNYVLSFCVTESYKNSFINRCLFNYVGCTILRFFVCEFAVDY